MQRDTEGGHGEEGDDNQRWSANICLMQPIEVFHEKEWKKAYGKGIRQTNFLSLSPTRYSLIIYSIKKIHKVQRGIKEYKREMKKKKLGEDEKRQKAKKKVTNRLARINKPSFDLKIVTPPVEKADKKRSRETVTNL